MLNRAVLTGRLTRDVDLKYTQSGTAVASFSLAVDRAFKNKQGEREADFINVVMWRKQAENFANFAHKGSLVGIDGRIQTRNYENNQGQRVYVTEVVADNFSLLESRKDNQGQTNQQSNSNRSGSRSNQSKRSSQPTNDPFANNGDSIDITDEDLPF